MKPALDPSHQAVADRLHEEACCWAWRRQLIGDRLCELEDIEGAAELALVGYAGNAGIRDAVLHLRDLLDDAARMWMENELEYAEGACEQIEHALIALRRLARSLGVV